MATKLSRSVYAGMFGPTTGDRVRLADTDIIMASARAYLSALNKLAYLAAKQAQGEQKVNLI